MPIIKRSTIVYLMQTGIYLIMDLTQDYHQAPLEDNTKAFTAFITFSGVYEFTRLPFGPKRAPSYFQQIMATIVLVGLIYMMCEMYIDDCIVFMHHITSDHTV